MSTLNLGILAHVDAGKTTLTERLLYAAGVIDKVGSVDDGSTQTDFLALERQRGITIKSAVVSFAIGDVTVNLIDTPGHPDFIAEVERVLNVLDGAVLVVSAVEGVQAQTRVLMRTLRRLRIPALIFVNKIDRGGAHGGRTLAAIEQKLSPAVIAMGSADDLGSRAARYTPYTAADRGFTSRLTDLLADHDDALLAAYVRDEASVSYRRLRRSLAAQARRALVHPVFFGSAITGAGVDALAAGITELLPAAGADAGGPVSGTVFKVERGAAGEKVAYVRMFSGTARTRDQLPFGGNRSAKVTAISVFDRGSAVRRDRVPAGQIGKLWGLDGVQIGDAIGEPPAAPPGRGHFAPPTLETVVVPRRRADKGALHVALGQLAEQDPLINLRQRRRPPGDLRLALRRGAEGGHLGHAGRRLRHRCQLPREHDDLHRAAGRRGRGRRVHQPRGQSVPGHRGTAGGPRAAGSGVSYRVAGDRLGTMPVAFFKAVEETVRDTLRQGLRGWQVTDCTVTLTHTGYWPRQSHAHAHFDKSMSSTAGDFRQLTPLVLMSALARAGTTVYEPVHRFRLEAPADIVGPMLPVLARLRAIPRAPLMHGSSCVVEGEIPAARVHELERQLPGLTRGEGVLECEFSHYRPAGDGIAARPRTGRNPLDRKEYLLRVKRRP